MIFDINNIHSGSARASQSRNGSAPIEVKAPVTASPASAPSNEGDKVVLSQEAQGMNRLQSKMATTPDIDMDKVEAIKQAIAEGKFEFNAERIAENMLNQDDLLG